MKIIPSANKNRWRGIWGEILRKKLSHQDYGMTADESMMTFDSKIEHPIDHDIQIAL